MNKLTKPVIEIQNLSKVYRLYRKPNHRFLDMLGLLRPNQYTEHLALNDISLEINRGEKIGIIGRNGAGKSTLLKLISGVIGPSKGELHINGSARALLEIGSGFHPDFTGRENVLAYLAQIGVSGKEAHERLYEIIDFCELEEYIDQPLKTYSTGMGARIMFATSTAVAPDLLILDEILSVGDAYFTQKSMDRIKDLCEREGTTLLLVSHDIYSSAKICDRMIWIEKGQIALDDIPSETIKAYENSIRIQEEARIRSQAKLSIERANKNKNQNAANPIIFEFSTPQGGPFDKTIYISKLAFKIKNEHFEFELNPQNENSSLHPIFDGSCWGDYVKHQNKNCLPINNFGTVHHKAALICNNSDIIDKLTEHDSQLEIEYYVENECDVEFTVFQDNHLIISKQISLDVNKNWQHSSYTIDKLQLSSNNAIHIKSASSFGTGDIVCTDVRLLNKQGEKNYYLKHGEFAHFQIDYEIRDPNFNDKADVYLNILRDGVETACRFYTPQLHFDYNHSKSGTIDLIVPNLYLGASNYSILIMIGESGYNEYENHKYYSINEKLYYSARNLYEFRVEGGGVVANGTPYVAHGNWNQVTNQQLAEIEG